MARNRATCKNKVRQIGSWTFPAFKRELTVKIILSHELPTDKAEKHANLGDSRRY
jgi:hypothetical protein